MINIKSSFPHVQNILASDSSFLITLAWKGNGTGFTLALKSSDDKYHRLLLCPFDLVKTNQMDRKIQYSKVLKKRKNTFVCTPNFIIYAWLDSSKWYIQIWSCDLPGNQFFFLSFLLWQCQHSGQISWSHFYFLHPISNQPANPIDLPSNINWLAFKGKIQYFAFSQGSYPGSSYHWLCLGLFNSILIFFFFLLLLLFSLFSA
jgi:hypothetical protein